ncbi:MAG: STAS domain-containing protein [Planctomycetota bacterium]|nr:STAS domain-containing protein [Planctomycetota bacterium]
MINSTPNAFTLEQRGELTIVTATPHIESFEFGFDEEAAELIMAPLRTQDVPLLIFDLAAVDYFGSVFLAILLRCWKLAQARGGSMALAGVSDRARELLRLTSLDTLWPLYASRQEAIEALLAD